MHVMTLMQTMMAQMMVEMVESGSQQAASVVVWLQSVSQSAMSTCVQTTLISHSVPGLSVTDAAALQVKGKTHTRLPSVGFQS